MIDLAKVRANFDRRAGHFLGAVESAASQKDASARRDIDRLVAHTVIELETSVAYAARCAFLAGSLGGRNASGIRMTPNALTAREALTNASRALGRRAVAIPGRDEPSWSSATHVSDVAARVGPANATDMIAAMGVFPEARRCVKSFRDFFAHRGQDTLRVAWDKVQLEYGLAGKGHPALALLALSVDGGASVLETWIWNYVDVVHTLCG